MDCDQGDSIAHQTSQPPTLASRPTSLALCLPFHQVYGFLEQKAEQYVSAKIETLKRRELAIVQHRMSLRYGGPSPVHMSSVRRSSKNGPTHGEDDGRRRSSALRVASLPPTRAEGGMADTPRPIGPTASRPRASLSTFFRALDAPAAVNRGPELGGIVSLVPAHTEVKGLQRSESRRSVTEGLLDTRAQKVIEGLRRQISLLDVGRQQEQANEAQGHTAEEQG